MTVNELRSKYLDYFKSKKHTLFASDTLVPDDPTVLFTSAGMNQFKPYFLGEKKEIKRAVSAQKCLRTGDLEVVGTTPCHHTFFEMLGNFSFGDYFKKEAIEYAWEFLTKELNIKETDLWVSVYKDDSETFELWSKHIGIPLPRIIKFDEKDNFWPSNAPALGPNGPCGPCSEIYFDRGVKVGCGKSNCSPACDCRRYVEIWNLVFTQFNRIDINKLIPLPQKNIDTGMGLERMSAMMQGKESNFDIDILAPIVKQTREILHCQDMSFKTKGLINAIVDHVRAACFCVCDGVYPSNEERGYVARKIIRKAVWSAQLLNAKNAFLSELVPVFASIMNKPYPELEQKKDIIAKVIYAEEEKFLSTIRDGKAQFSIIIENLKNQNQSEVSAQDLFRLYDTYGFPMELSKIMAKEESLSIDEKGFEDLFQRQQQRSRKKSMFDETIFKENELKLTEITEFLGYACLKSKSKIIRIFKNNQEVEAITAKDNAVLILDNTPFYSESGGQTADKGIIAGDAGEFLVENVIKIGKTILHKGIVTVGTIKKETVYSAVDSVRRGALSRAHTATHLLQAALRTILGTHVVQQGSLVDEDKLRFDFTHFKALTSDETAKIEMLVNDKILENIAVCKQEMTIDEAKRIGALAFFKDKYEEKVRVISIGRYSSELCGGTHLENTAQIGGCLITGESSISSGVRRIEAVTGFKAYQRTCHNRQVINQAAEILKTTDEEIIRGIIRLREELSIQTQTAMKLNKELLFLKVDDMVKNSFQVNETAVIVREIPNAAKTDLLFVGDILCKRNDTALTILFSAQQQKTSFVIMVSDKLVKNGLTAKMFAAKFGTNLGLNGGGRDALIQGVITTPTIDFVEKCKTAAREFLK